MMSDYVLKVIENNADRADDIVFDTGNLEQTAAVIGVKCVAQDIGRSLRALIEGAHDSENVKEAAMTVDWLADFINNTTSRETALEKAIALLSRSQ
jgi:hypothetical protein